MIRLNNGNFEVPLSEVIEIDGTLIQAVRDSSAYSCKKCFFYKRNCQNILCESERRLDRREVYFEVVKEKEDKNDTIC